VLVEGVSRSSAAITDYPYGLDRGSEALVLRTRAGLVAGSRLEAAVGALTLTGQSATLTYRRGIAGGAGSLVLNGYGAGSIRDYRIGTNFGTFAATGQNAIVALQRAPLAAGAGSFALSGQGAGYRKGIIAPANNGTFTFDGQVATLTRSLRLRADSATYLVDGKPSIAKPQLIGSQINSDATADTSAVVTVPSNAQGDLLIAVLMWRNDRGTLTVPSGWTLQGTYTSSIMISGVQQNLLVYTKTASASEPATYTWTAATSTRNAWLSASVRFGQIDTVSENYGNGTTATISTVADRLNLTVFTWVYAQSSGSETYSQSAADSSLTQITDSPKANARISGGYTRNATTVTSTHAATDTLNNPNHGGINIQIKGV